MEVRNAAPGPDEKAVVDNSRAGALRVALVGVYPPPYGGVSIHIQRLLAGCLENGIRCTVFDHTFGTKNSPNLVNLLRWPFALPSRQDIIHVHTVDRNWQIPEFFRCLAAVKRARLVVSYHALKHRPGDFSRLGRRLTRDVLTSAAHVIAVNPVIKDKLLSLGATPEKMSVIPAFLPPEVKEEDIAAVPPEVWTFMAGHRPLICGNAFAIIKDKGEDRYGIDLCVELCAALKSIFPGVGLVFYLPSIRDYGYFNELKRRISEKDIGDNFLFQNVPCPFYPVLMKSDIFVRPTSSEGDAISVREALYFKVPAVASDVAPRPEGTVLFKNRDAAAFIARVKSVWENYQDYREKMESLAVANPLAEILKIYRGLV